MTKNEIARLKTIEIELAYLRKTIEEFMKEKNVEIHYHKIYNYSNMRPMIITDKSILDKLNFDSKSKE